MTKTFLVAAASSNTNSFGLRSFVLVAADGEAWQVLRSAYVPGLPDWSKQAVLTFGAGGYPTAPGCECQPVRLPNCPRKVYREVRKCGGVL